MSATIAYYGGIVTDGLVLYMDAAKRDSYPGFGTNWNSVARGGLITGNLTNGPGFTIDSGGGINFDGVDDYINFGTTEYTSIRSLTTLTLNFIFYCTGFSNSSGGFSWAPLISIDRFNSGNNYRKFSFYTRLLDGVQGMRSDFFNGSGGSSGVEYNTQILNRYLIVSSTVDSNSTKLYVNGDLVNEYTGITVNSNPQDSEFTIASRINTLYNGYFKGNIYMAQIYNRALSATEVLQNYNATKGRFGL